VTKLGNLNKGLARKGPDSGLHLARTARKPHLSATYPPPTTRGCSLPFPHRHPIPTSPGSRRREPLPRPRRAIGAAVSTPASSFSLAQRAPEPHAIAATNPPTSRLPPAARRAAEPEADCTRHVSLLSRRRQRWW